MTDRLISFKILAMSPVRLGHKCWNSAGRCMHPIYTKSPFCCRHA